MKQYQIINAYNATEELANVDGYSEKEQWAIYQLRKELRPHVEFQNERAEVLRKKYIPYANEEGKLDAIKTQEYMNDVQEINELDKDIKFNKIKLPLTKGVNFKLIEALEGFIEFEP